LERTKFFLLAVERAGKVKAPEITGGHRVVTFLGDGGEEPGGSGDITKKGQRKVVNPRRSEGGGKRKWLTGELFVYRKENTKRKKPGGGEKGNTTLDQNEVVRLFGGLPCKGSQKEKKRDRESYQGDGKGVTDEKKIRPEKKRGMAWYVPGLLKGRNKKDLWGGLMEESGVRNVHL